MSIASKSWIQQESAMRLRVFSVFICAAMFSACREQKQASEKPMPSVIVRAMVIESCARSVIPLSALVENDGVKAYVFVISTETSNDGTRIVKRVPVGIYKQSQFDATLRTPLPVGSSIVMSGAELLEDGGSVSVNPGL
jgi:hypothetical protein